MKALKSILVLGVFSVALTAMSTPNEREKEINQKEILKMNVPCSTVYTVCDKAHPDSYGNFASCMDKNGC
ncbi:hypothetical protein A9264_16490 [Vibrio sp. UCD-FRSSP16_10]|uniref:Kazal-like domain-containing protein n=1 Tax=Tenacibaculum soleae TaxID=447689 RepID=A0A1B9Y0S7_9FLAO|nr:hypothetical protein [Tenacibaculum soleae]OBT12957.1 hypothetical protein A9264_16490 [Vibrio sp. UCD-FRSSP16_10]OCK43403.1 hypothetical protein BA195_01480 [Tenacibaculum soleae]